MDYTLNSAEVFTTKADKRLPNVNSNEMCARACTTNPDFRCESFEICDDGYCNLRKTHLIQAKPSDLTNATSCTHYSRNHLYDYVERDYKTLNSFGDSSSSSHSVPVESAQECANLCSVGELLPSCASFVTCGIDRGSIECTVTTADPTVSTDIGIISDEHCNLYTRMLSQHL
uniref:Apple domain-containing protein n=1 Tax=Biomphalaria glabrata TaxID=6526 RepID=A0A2C9LGJ7_BIOGL